MTVHPIPFKVEIQQEDLVRVLDVLLSAGFKVSGPKWIEAGLKKVLPKHVFEAIEFVSHLNGTSFYASSAPGG